MGIGMCWCGAVAPWWCFTDLPRMVGVEALEWGSDSFLIKTRSDGCYWGPCTVYIISIDIIYLFTIKIKHNYLIPFSLLASWLPRTPAKTPTIVSLLIFLLSLSSTRWRSTTLEAGIAAFTRRWLGLRAGGSPRSTGCWCFFLFLLGLRLVILSCGCFGGCRTEG